MSFDIVLQTNNSEDNRLTKDLTDIITLSGTLRDSCSILEPVIMIATDSIPTTANYMTIAEFGRSYFIRDITSVRNGLYQISAHVDVLSTYAEQLKACGGIVQRQENDWNLYVDDSAFWVYQNPYVLTRQFPSGFTTQEFVLAVAGS